jgi:hypothetical protein
MSSTASIAAAAMSARREFFGLLIFLVTLLTIS